MSTVRGNCPRTKGWEKKDRLPPHPFDMSTCCVLCSRNSVCSDGKVASSERRGLPESRQSYEGRNTSHSLTRHAREQIGESTADNADTRNQNLECTATQVTRCGERSHISANSERNGMRASEITRRRPSVLAPITDESMTSLQEVFGKGRRSCESSRNRDAIGCSPTSCDLCSGADRTSELKTNDTLGLNRLWSSGNLLRSGRLIAASSRPVCGR